MKDTDLAWLAGIVDGEGCLRLFSCTEKNGDKKIKFVFNIVNTDEGIINKILEIASRLNVNFHVQELQPKNKKHRLQWRLATSNMKYIKILLEAIIPFLFGIKKARGEILLRYVNQRMNKIDVRHFNGTTPYDVEDWSYIEKFRSSETTREAA